MGTGALDLGLLALVAPFLRYLLGAQLVDSGGNILAIGLLHVSFNASGRMSAGTGGWQYVPAMIMLTLAAMAYRPLPDRSVIGGFAPAWSQTQRPCEPRASLSGR